MSSPVHRQDGTTPAPPPSPSSSPLPAKGFALAVTNVTKLGGLAVALNEALLRTEVRPLALAVAAFMMAGAQGVETFLDRLLGR